MAFLVYQGTRRRLLLLKGLYSWWFLSGLVFVVLPLYRVLHQVRLAHPNMSLRREDDLLRAPRLLQEQQQPPEGHDAFPVIAQSYFSSYREMMYGNAFPAVIKIGHAHAGQGKMQISSHRYLMTCDLLSP
jgi:hypothetical protein